MTLANGKHARTSFEDIFMDIFLWQLFCFYIYQLRFLLKGEMKEVFLGLREYASIGPFRPRRSSAFDRFD